MSKAKRNKKGKKVRKSGSSASSDKRRLWLALGSICLVTIIAMSPLFNADFVDIDDKKLILDKDYMFLDNPGHIFDFSFRSPHYKPVTFLTWMLEYRAAGPNPFIFHFNNILLHVLNCILVFFLIRGVASRFERLKGHEFHIAWFSALLFGVHPMHVESVGWAVERKDVLYTCFYLAGLLSYVRYLDSRKVLPLALSAGAYLLSTMSKSPGITMLPVLFLFDFIWQRKFSAQLFIEKLGHFGVFGFSLYALGIVGRSHGEGSMAAMLTEKKLARASNIAEHSSLYGKALLAGLRATLWYVHSLFPIKLSLGYPREQIIGFFGPFIHVFPWILIGAAAALLKFSKKYMLLFFAHAFFFLTLAPAIVRLDLGIGIYMSDRYVYLSLLGLIFLVVAWIWTAQEKGWITQRTKTGILVAIVAICTIASFMESRVWRNTETLWTNVIDKYPMVDYAWINRASFYREQGLFDKGLADATKGIALHDDANGRVQRGLIYRQMGNPEAALTDYNRALALEPDNTQAYTNRGNALLDMGRFRQAIEDYQKVLAAEPGNIKTRVNMAIAYSSLREFSKAEEVFAQAQKSNKSYADLYVNRAIMYFEMKEYAKALVDYEAYLKLRPDDHQIWNDRGIVLSLMGRYQDAVGSFTQAITLSPVKDYFKYRAQAYDRLGNSAAAQQDRQRAQ